MQIILNSIDETRQWAAQFAKTLQPPVTVGLVGDLGMGKSEIARAIIKTLCGDDTIVPSPTFTIVQEYESKLGVRSEELEVRSEELGVRSEELGVNRACDNTRALKQEQSTPNSSLLTSNSSLLTPNFISHFDLYRISDMSELEEIGLRHAIENNICLIEWPEIAEHLLPKDAIRINIFEHGEGRKLVIENL
jgi:tRNA threonylcarbamoyl adenosine modification protein YjeE